MSPQWDCPPLDKLGREAPGAVTVDADGGVLPVTEADIQVGILVRHVDAAGVGGGAVNDGDLPVVPVVKVNAVHIAVYGIEHLHLNAGVLHGLEGIV